MSGAGRASSGPMRDDLWRLDGRVALVTGASSGLGVASRGRQVLVIDGGWTAV
jgi:hypothetical protein